jgi:SAM-dependent methyltransferase
VWDRALEEFTTTGAHQLWRRYSDAVNRELLDQWLPAEPMDRVLKTDLFDEATSDGIVPFLQARTRLVVGIDLAPFVLARAREGCPGLLAVENDVRDLSFADSTFDRVVSLSTLDHFESIDEIGPALRELCRVLRPGGELVLTLDNLANPVVRLRNALPIRPLHRLGIVPYFVGKSCGPRRLESLVLDTGLEVVEKTAIMHAPRALAVAVARFLGSRSSPEQQESFLRRLRGFERCRGWSTRFLTGYFVAIRAVKLGPGVAGHPPHRPRGHGLCGPARTAAASEPPGTALSCQ